MLVHPIVLVFASVACQQDDSPRKCVWFFQLSLTLVARLGDNRVYGFLCYGTCNPTGQHSGNHQEQQNLEKRKSRNRKSQILKTSRGFDN